MFGSDGRADWSRTSGLRVMSPAGTASPLRRIDRWPSRTIRRRIYHRLVVVDKRQVAQGERNAPGELPARALETAHVDELRDRTAGVEHGHAGCRQLDRVLADGTDKIEDRAPE